jgi:hypothetical protein
MQQTPKSKTSDKYCDNGIKTSLSFFIRFGKLVKVNASSSAESTIQNQESFLSIAKLQIKHGISATT